MIQDNRVAKNGGRDPNGPNKKFHAFEDVSNNTLDLPSLIEKTLPKLIQSSGAQLFGDNSLGGQIFLGLKENGGQKKTLHVNILLRTHTHTQYIFGHFSLKKTFDSLGRKKYVCEHWVGHR